MWNHLILNAAQSAQSNAGSPSGTLLGVIASGFFGVLIVAVDRILSKRRPRSDRVQREQEHLDKQAKDLYDRLLQQVHEISAELDLCRPLADRLREDNINLRAENLDLRGQIVALQRQVGGKS